MNTRADTVLRRKNYEKKFYNPEIETSNLSEIDIVLTSTPSPDENTDFKNWSQWH